MPNEVELKLRIRAADLPRLRQHPAVKQALVGKPVTRRLTSIYYDTPQLALLDASLSLRVRRMSGGWFQAVKGAGHSLAGLHQRMEWEDIIAHGEPDFSKITDPALTQVFDDPDLRAALRPIFTTDVRRTEWQLAPAPDSQIEMALDVGELIIDSADNAREPICEVELELKQGAAEHLFAFALALLLDIPLWIENISKAQRGYAYYRPQPPAARHARDVRLKPAMTVPDACRAVLWECIAQLQGNHDAVLAGDGEAVHQMRVALRRMRSAMKVFADLLPPDAEIEDDLRWLAGLLGEARDLDVLLDSTLPAMRVPLDHPALATLENKARKARVQAYQVLDSALEAQRYQQLLLRLGIWLEQLPHKAPTKLADYAATLLQKRHRRLQRHGKHWHALPAKERHATRIDAKKLRYAAEFFAGLYPAEPTRRYLHRLTRLLGTLGQLNDLAVTEHLVARLRGTRPSRALAELPLLFAGWNAALAQPKLAALKKQRARFAAARRFWD